MGKAAGARLRRPGVSIWGGGGVRSEAGLEGCSRQVGGAGNGTAGDGTAGDGTAGASSAGEPVYSFRPPPSGTPPPWCAMCDHWLDKVHPNSVTGWHFLIRCHNILSLWSGTCSLCLYCLVLLLLCSAAREVDELGRWREAYRGSRQDLVSRRRPTKVHHCGLDFLCRFFLPRVCGSSLWVDSHQPWAYAGTCSNASQSSSSKL